jgi:hypothetical protein
MYWGLGAIPLSMAWEGFFNSDLELLSTTRLGCPDSGILRPDFVV